jgi:hypothetical protein
LEFILIIYNIIVFISRKSSGDCWDILKLNKIKLFDMDEIEDIVRKRSTLSYRTDHPIDVIAENSPAQYAFASGYHSGFFPPEIHHALCHIATLDNNVHLAEIDALVNVFNIKKNQEIQFKREATKVLAILADERKHGRTIDATVNISAGEQAGLTQRARIDSDGQYRVAQEQSGAVKHVADADLQGRVAEAEVLQRISTERESGYNHRTELQTNTALSMQRVEFDAKLKMALAHIESQNRVSDNELEGVHVQSQTFLGIANTEQNGLTERERIRAKAGLEALRIQGGIELGIAQEYGSVQRYESDNQRLAAQTHSLALVNIAQAEREAVLKVAKIQASTELAKAKYLRETHRDVERSNITQAYLAVAENHLGRGGKIDDLPPLYEIIGTMENPVRPSQRVYISLDTLATDVLHKINSKCPIFEIQTFNLGIDEYDLDAAIYDLLVPRIVSLNSEYQDHFVLCHSVDANARQPKVDRYIAENLKDVNKTVLYINNGNGSQLDTLQKMMEEKC